MAWEGLIIRILKHFLKVSQILSDAQIAMFPKMMNNRIADVIDSYRKAACLETFGCRGRRLSDLDQ